MTRASASERIKSTVTVDDVLVRYAMPPLRHVANGRVGSCPICGIGKAKRSRAFKVSVDGRAWYCFGDCKRGGSVIDLVMALEQCDARQALALLRS